MTAKIIETDHDTIAFQWGDVTLFQYIARSKVPLDESPKPYFHPIRNLNGNTITNFRPNDHPWHHGLSMTMTLVNKTNYWGGNTYRQEDGYRMRNNFGTQQHVDWSEKVVTQTGVRLAENLDWINEHSRMDMTEKRVIEADVFAQDDCWRLRTTCEFQNVSGEILRLGTFQSEEGLQGSHYTGMFLRLSRDFMGVGEWQPYGSYLAEGQHGVEQVHGVQSSWLACVGSHDNCNVSTTLICCDNPENPNYPVHWFYRPDMPCLALPFVGSGAVILEPNETLRLSYDFIIANGIREAEERHRLVREFVTERAAVQV